MNLSRRRFIGLGATVSFTALLASDAGLLARGGTRPELRVSIAGLGAVGRVRLREVLAAAGCRLVAVCEVDQGRVAEAMAEVAAAGKPAPAAYEQLETMLRASRSNLVVIASPDHWHAAHITAACRAGVHVWAEAPLALSEPELAAVVESAATSGRELHVAADWSGAVIQGAALESLRQNSVGKIRRIEISINRRVSLLEQPAPITPPPREINWFEWCGPAGPRPFSADASDHAQTAALFFGGWRRSLDHSLGPIGSEGCGPLAFALAALEVERPDKVPRPLCLSRRAGNHLDPTGSTRPGNDALSCRRRRIWTRRASDHYTERKGLPEVRAAGSGLHVVRAAVVGSDGARHAPAAG